MSRIQAELLESVAPEFRHEFVRFVETGEASEGFFDYLDADESCLAALEEALAPETELIRGAIELIRREVREDGRVGGAPARRSAARWSQ